MVNGGLNSRSQKPKIVNACPCTLHPSFNGDLNHQNYDKNVWKHPCHSTFTNSLENQLSTMASSKERKIKTSILRPSPSMVLKSSQIPIVAGFRWRNLMKNCKVQVRLSWIKPDENLGVTQIVTSSLHLLKCYYGPLHPQIKATTQGE